VKNTFFEVIDEDGEQQQPMITRAETESTALRSFKLARPFEATDETEECLNHGIERSVRAATEPTLKDDPVSDPVSEGPIRVATESVLVTETLVYDPGMPHEVEEVHWERRETVASFVSSHEASGDDHKVGHSTSGSKELRTTLMLRNLPLDYTRDMLLHLLDMEGFAGKYDFIYLPVDFKTRSGLGYAFLNVVSATEAELVHVSLDGFNDWVMPSNKVCAVEWSTELQGLEAHIGQWKNSAVMHRSVPDEFKPAIFNDGVQVAFPRPTKRLKKPDQSKHERPMRPSCQMRQRGA